MADLTRRRERGQILLIAAFTLAVIFVALALVVNSAIFTENLASRGEVTGSSEALIYQHQVEQSVAAAIEHANQYDYASTLQLDTSIKDSIAAIGARGGRQQATGGQLVQVEYDNWEPGVRIVDKTAGGSDFKNHSTPTNVSTWQVADSVAHTRNVAITVTDTSELSSGPGLAFTLQANESGSPTDAWRMRVWRDSTANEVVVDVETNTGLPIEECRVPDTDPVEIEVTRGLINGERCHALTRTGTGGDQMWWGTGLTTSTYEIWILNGEWIRGNYSMVVDGNPNDDNLQFGPSSDYNPYQTEAIYRATVEYVFQTTEVTYETEVEVAPGEPPS